MDKTQNIFINLKYSIPQILDQYIHFTAQTKSTVNLVDAVNLVHLTSTVFFLRIQVVTIVLVLQKQCYRTGNTF